MDNSTDQRKTHTPGHESHGVHVCHKCGWHFPNPHPSAKHRRAHKKICGTIEGYNRSNGSDDERGSDDDKKTPGPKALDIGNNEKGSKGIGEKINRSEDEVFSDAVADFSDTGLSQGVKKLLHEVSLDSGTSVEGVDQKDLKFSVSFKDSDYKDADMSQFDSRDDCQIKHPKILQGERVEVGNTPELQGQFSGSTVDPLSNSVAYLRAEESTAIHGNDSSGLPTESHPSKAEAMPDVLPQNEMFAGENVTDLSLASAALETNLTGKEEIKSHRDEAEIVVPSEGESKIAVSDAVYSHHQLAEGAVNPKENVSAEFLSVPTEDDPPLGSNFVVQVEPANVVQLANSCDVEILQEKEEGDANANNTLPTSEDRTDVPHSSCECGDFKDNEGLVSQSYSGLHSSKSSKCEDDADFKVTVTEENSFLFSPSHLAEKSDILSVDKHVMVSPEEMLAEEHTEVVKLTVEISERSDETGASMNAVKSEMNESHAVHFTEELEPDDVENSQQRSSPESVLIPSSNENPRDTSFGSVISETTRAVSIDDISHHENNRTEINDVAVDGKDVGANSENDLQPSDQPQLEVEQSSDVFKSDGAGEMDKIESSDITDAQFRENASYQIESPVISEAVIDATGKSKAVKEDEINSNVKVHEECNRSFGTSADSHQSPDAELLGKAAEDIRDCQTDREVSGITATPVQDQSVNSFVKHSSSGFDSSVVSSSRCDSLEANWGSVSVRSMQSDAPGVIDAGTSPPTEAGKSNLNNPKAASSERQQSGKSEMFEAPSFMTLVKPGGHGVSHVAPASEVQKGKNPQQPSFPSQTQTTNESQGKKSEEIIARVTNWSSGKEHTPLKSLFGEAAQSDKPRSPKLEENSLSQKNVNGSGLKTVNSILGPESPAAQAATGDAAKEWNSPARYPAEMKREKRKGKSRPYWIQLVCCSSVDLQTR